VKRDEINGKNYLFWENKFLAHKGGIGDEKYGDERRRRKERKKIVYHWLRFRRKKF
jgi:hypothetical protein